MKKLLLTFTLLSGLSLMGMESFAPTIPTKPTLQSVLTKKYVQRMPLTKQEKTYLKKTGKRAIAAGLAALGIAAAGVAGVLGYRYKYARPDATEVFKEFGINLEGQELRNALIIANAANLNELFRARTGSDDAYAALIKAHPNFKRALAKIKGVDIKDLPEGQFSF